MDTFAHESTTNMSMLEETSAPLLLVPMLVVPMLRRFKAESWIRFPITSAAGSVALKSELISPVTMMFLKDVLNRVTIEKNSKGYDPCGRLYITARRMCSEGGGPWTSQIRNSFSFKCVLFETARILQLSVLDT